MNNIAQQRLHNQHISQKQFTEPGEVVQHMTAIQAQDYYSSLWAIGVRTSSDITESQVEQAIADRKIVRTWPMRGTLHFVAAEDTRWMLHLLSPRVIKGSAGRHKELELDETAFIKSRKLLENALQGGNKLTRSEVYNVLENGGIQTQGQRGYHILWYLAQTGVICQANRRGKQDTFVLLDEWIPKSKDLKGDEALSELTSRYLHSRGPATEYDFAYWSGLKVTTARKALQMVEDNFHKTKNDEHTWWFPDPPELNFIKSSGTYFLPAFDEMICGYKDRSAILPSGIKQSIILKNGIFKAVVISETKVAGTWKRSLKKERVIIEVELFDAFAQTQQKILAKRGQKYGNFLDLEAEIII